MFNHNYAPTFSLEEEKMRQFSAESTVASKSDAAFYEDACRNLCDTVFMQNPEFCAAFKEEVKFMASDTEYGSLIKETRGKIDFNTKKSLELSNGSSLDETSPEDRIRNLLTQRKGRVIVNLFNRHPQIAETFKSEIKSEILGLRRDMIERTKKADKLQRYLASHAFGCTQPKEIEI